MNELEAFCESHYERVNVISDPVYGYVPFTKRPDKPGITETAEEDLIDSDWVQRLRRIHQLQAAWWVFPSGEHTRFQHSLGTMHLAGGFARHLYESLQAVCERDIPSQVKVVETARVAGLLHDIGHGPFGHFFDDYYLRRWGITHETVGQEIIMGPLRQLIESIRRSTEDDFKLGEQLRAEDIAYLIKKPEQGNEKQANERWLSLLRAIFTGIYTADSLDYVTRDAYMTGVCLDPVDIDRLIYYTHFRQSDGNCLMTLHLHGIGALQRFLQARFYMYDNVYCHRTVRAIELDMRDIFEATIDKLLKRNPIEDLESYLALDEWSLISMVSEWSKQASNTLEQGWKRIIERKPRWHRIFERRHQLVRRDPMTRIWTEDELQRAIYSKLPSYVREKLRLDDIRVDIASFHPRPENPYRGEYAMEIYDPVTRKTVTEHWDRILMEIPARAFIVRVFALSEEYAQEIYQAATEVLSADRTQEDFPSNI